MDPEKLRQALKACERFDDLAGLRPYQSKGLNWLNFLHTHRFGACLADDMGLGKTIQILALLSTFSKKLEQPASLLVVPAIHRIAMTGTPVENR